MIPPLLVGRVGIIIGRGISKPFAEPVNLVHEIIFNSLFYCIDFFFPAEKILQAILAVHEACICRYKNINAVEERAGTLLQKYFSTTKLLHYFTVKQKIKTKHPSRTNLT